MATSRVLENLRYHTGETKNDIDFAKQLAALGDIYVDDAFSSRPPGACLGRGHRPSACRLMPGC